MDTAHTDIYANIRKNGQSTFRADGTPVPFFLPLVLDVDYRGDDDGVDGDGDVLTERNSGSELNGSDEGGGFYIFFGFGLITPIFAFLFAAADNEALAFAAFVFAAFVAFLFFRAAFFFFTCSPSAIFCHV